MCPSKTHDLKIHGYKQDVESLTSLGVYGSDADAILAMAAADKRLGQQLHPALPYIAAEVIWGVREEMARTLDDVLSRRTRALFLNARAAIEMAPAVAKPSWRRSWAPDRIGSTSSCAIQ